MICSFKGHYEIVKMLLQHGADIHKKVNTTVSALDNARSQGHTAIEKLLSHFIEENK